MRFSDDDAPFFREWQGRATRVRDQRRAAHLLHLLGGHPSVPVLAIVGSKGKGTTAAYATKILTAAGYRVGTITSPGYLTNRERVRIDGAPVTPTQFHELSARFSRAQQQLPPSESGYLAPTGCYTIAGATWLAPQVDVLVLEEGLGGVSDELNLFTPTVLAATEIFVEHADLLGGTVEEIAADLVGVTKAATGAIVTGRQSRAVAGVIEAVAAATATPVHAAGVSALPWPLGYNAGVALAAARELTGREDLHLPERVNLLGRSSRHRAHGREWVLDAAITTQAVRTTLAEHYRGQSLLVGWGDDKDVDEIFDLIDQLRIPHRAVQLPAHLSATRQAARATPLPAADAVAWALQEGGDVLAVGTISMIASIAAHLDITDLAW